MQYELRWSPDAVDHLAGLTAQQRTTVVDQSELHLRNQPEQPTKKRKLLRENPLATWELRVGRLRVLYNIDTEDKAVEIVAVGIKDRNRLLIGGEEIEL